MVRDQMVTAVLVSFEDDGVLAMPSEPIDLNKLIGKKVIYKDYKDKEWLGYVVEIVGTFVKIKFNGNPDGLGQGVIMDILD
jgi:ribosomal protein L35AE/L33A